MLPKLLILVEIGYFPLDRLVANLFIQLVSRLGHRHIEPEPGQLGKISGDPAISTAILDRLLHLSTTANVKGRSYLLKKKRTAG